MLRTAFEGTRFPLEIFVGEKGKLVHETKWWRLHWKLVHKARQIIRSRRFLIFVAGAIMVTSLVIGVQVQNADDMSPAIKARWQAIEWGCNGVFLLEVALKV
jgi:hypothetical protein